MLLFKRDCLHKWAKCVFFIFLFLNSFILFSQNKNVKKVIVSGYVTDELSGETLIQANVVYKDNLSGVTVGTTTNSYGFYSIALPVGENDLMYSYIGYKNFDLKVNVKSDTLINIRLRPNMSINEVVVTADKEAQKNITYTGVIDIPISQIKNMPAVFGEHDILRAIQLLPGVQSGFNGTSGIFVRGGGVDENLMLLDGVALYNVDHMLGIFSVFTPEAVKKVTFYKGAFPAKYSGRISSIVDVRTNDGNMNKFSGTVSTGLLSTKFHLDGPIIKNKTSFSLSTRVLNTLFFDRIIAASTSSPGNYFFYDFNSKITHRFSDKDRLSLSVYNGLDKFYFKEKDTHEYSGKLTKDIFKNNIAWGNTIVALRWNHIFGNKIFMNASTYFNRYNMKIGYEEETKNAVDYSAYSILYNSKIKDYGAKFEFEYQPTTSHNIQFGAEYVSHNFFPDIMSEKVYEKEGGVVIADTTYKFGKQVIFSGHEASFYAEDNIKIGSKLILSPGIHFSIFNTKNKTYFEPEPRISLKYDFIKNLSLKAAYSRMSQYVHLLSSSQVTLPTDLWVPITDKIKPVTSDQYSLGFYYKGIEGWDFSVEGYYKQMKNILEYKDGASSLGNNSVWDNLVEVGDGRAFGAEFMAQKTFGKHTGWLSYTLAKSDRIFKDGSINNGKRFPFKYDRRHSINLYYNYKASAKVDLNCTWTFVSGGTITVPKRISGIIVTDITAKESGVLEYSYVDGRNNYRLPPTHILNFGVNFTKQKQRGIRIWNISVYNLYNHMTPNLMFTDVEYYKKGSEQKSKLVLKKYTILPILPSFSYTYKF